jgi:hypothetical protein
VKGGNVVLKKSTIKGALTSRAALRNVKLTQESVDAFVQQVEAKLPAWVEDQAKKYVVAS